ncbi:hypothetical protein K402DRAFT_400752 [Aulographum hederae CBS 113979]|uniref:BRCT domain-containing protein n=1 Tax=Aulographum hederae CBS 113979 TaxID=1176131 RepID=A0A6G1HDJ4_9PEZI|nr:hypothetical protein K402DRAFT_400752 [Aulographum hederae CBS 113979]
MDGHGFADGPVKERPLAGVILCCTSIPPDRRKYLAERAVDMGAVHKYDLTSDVTHLIIGDLDTPKYKYVAKERPDVKVVSPGFIEKLLEQWTEDVPCDVAQFERRYRVPTFMGLRICVTGFTDESERKKMQESVTRQGAEYSGDLTKRVTHLIAAKPEGGKYTHALQWNIKVVSIEWLRDSTDRGMVLEEALYNPILPQEERGKGAWNRNALANAINLKRARQEDGPPELNERRKLRRTASAKLGSQQGMILAHITSGGGSSRGQESLQDHGDLRTDPQRRESSASSGTRTTSRTSSTVSQLGRPQTVFTAVEQALPLIDPSSIFHGCLIMAHGFPPEKTKLLHEHLALNGASLLRSPQHLDEYENSELENGLLVVPHDIPVSSLPPLPQSADVMTKVTEWWVEKCLLRECVVDPSAELLCRPLKLFAVEGFTGLVVSSTSFQDVDRLHIQKVVNLMGGTYDEYLRKTTSVLVCGSGSPPKQKLEFSQESGVPAVRVSWLWACIETGKVQPYEDHLILPIASVRSDTERIGLRQHVTDEDVKHVRKTQARPVSPMRRKGSLSKHDSSRSRAKLNPDANLTLTGLGSGLTVAQATMDRKEEFEPSAGGDVDPLRETDANSPKKPPLQTDGCADSTPRDTSSGLQKPLSGVSAVTDESSDNLTNSIAALLARQQAARPVSASESKKSRRKRDFMGRAQSNASTNSAPISQDGGFGSMDMIASQGREPLPARDFDNMDVYVPTQALVYEDPGLQKEREGLIRKIGGKVEEGEGRTVQSIGAAKDAGFAEEAGVGQRVKRRSRQ